MTDKKELLEKYVEHKRVIKEAEAQLEILAEAIKEFAHVDDVFELDGAAVSCMKGKPKYIYSPATTELEKSLKETQKEEVMLGVAEVVYGSPFLQVKFTK